ncbi:hypothetical protein COV11_03925 [Candidatus Woesearchaeota archaeon CG10_big_fil_rev_8_21_14_0_10_30_7]|nr:MAG: hypothetical protein COV11_03925 [Candidatus Woesearchaeota archaeon CG10_big_fil_rev_8_21_14_0_10_30_7]
MKEKNKSLAFGSLTGLFGSLCCTAPLVLVLLGLSTVSGGMSLAGYFQETFRWTLFIPLATLFLILAIYFHIKNKNNVCNLKTLKANKIFVLTTVFSAIIVWVLLLYVIIPAIFGLL